MLVLMLMYTEFLFFVLATVPCLEKKYGEHICFYFFMKTVRIKRLYVIWKYIINLPVIYY